MSSQTMSEYIDLAEVEGLAGSLRTAVSKFVESLCLPMIDYSEECKLEIMATAALEEFNSACNRAEMETGKISDQSLAKQIRQGIIAIKDVSRVDMITYNRALLKFNRRKAKYENTSPRTRERSPPRSGAADVWKNDSQCEQNPLPGSGMGIIVFLFFIIIAVVFARIIPQENIGNSFVINLNIPILKKNFMNAICQGLHFVRGKINTQWIVNACVGNRSIVE